MADQSDIDNAALLIADLVDKAKSELIDDLYKLIKEEDIGTLILVNNKL